MTLCVVTFVVLICSLDTNTTFKEPLSFEMFLFFVLGVPKNSLTV